MKFLLRSQLVHFLREEYFKCMQKILFTMVSFFVAFAYLPHAHATVGGPTVIDSFKYNPADESVYYTLLSESGRGCPPLLMKISLNSGKSTIVLSCEQGEALARNKDYNQSIAVVNTEIARRTEGFKKLIPISLPNNKITVDVDFLREKRLEGSPEWIMGRDFTGTFYQNNMKITEFPVFGCNLEQPFTFAGYAIPGFEKKIILLLSTKGDCWEGGYTYEAPYVVGGMKVLDRTHANFWKSSSPLVPNEATLVVFEKDEPVSSPVLSSTSPASPSPLSPRANEYPIGALVAVGVLALLLGVTLGGTFFKKR